jgi:GNAT superfamily N-acetyltransferase
MIDILLLPSADLRLIGEIDRSEHVTVEYLVDRGQLITNTVDWDVPTFDPEGNGEHSVYAQVEHWEPIVEQGSVLIGAFEGHEFLGLAIVDPVFESDLAWLAFLHVSRRYRRKGVATSLWNEAAHLADFAGSGSIYVSAAPTGSAVGFYLSKGCTLAKPPHRDLFEEEPEDIHLICPIEKAQA